MSEQHQWPENARFTGWEESDTLQGGHSQMPCGGASLRPSRQTLSRWIRETWREGIETPGCPSHISVSSSWAAAESGENISRGKKGVLSACRHEMHHVGSQTWACTKLALLTPGVLLPSWNYTGAAVPAVSWKGLKQKQEFDKTESGMTKKKS